MSRAVVRKVTAEFWKQCAGQVVDGAFTLEKYLGGSANSAVYLTVYSGKKAAIKLIPADAKDADLQLDRWQAASKLSHPHLIQLLKFGRCKLGDAAAIYVVMEYMDESLSQVLPERPLTTEETGQMLEPLLSVLGYLHSEGWVHGHVKSSNIMAVDDQLKISSDGIARAGESKSADPAEDVWAVGLTLIEVLTQRREALVPATLPEPFRDIARRCLQPDPSKRWKVADISARLRGGGSKLRYLIPAAAVVLAAVAWFAFRSSNETAGTAAPPVTQVEQKKAAPEAAAPARAENAPAPVPAKVQPAPPEKPRAKPPIETPAPADSSTSAAPHEGIVKEVMPDIPAKARGTIHNRAKVSVKVRVDPAGNVLDAKLESPSPSKYFAERALVAARQWKFKPSDAEQEWALRFEVYRTETKVFPVRVNQ